MPIYEYICHTCGHDFEKIVRYSDGSTRPTCPTCGSFDTGKKLSKISVSGSSQNSGSSCSAPSSSPFQ